MREPVFDPNAWPTEPPPPPPPGPPPVAWPLRRRVWYFGGYGLAAAVLGAVLTALLRGRSHGMMLDYWGHEVRLAPRLAFLLLALPAAGVLCGLLLPMFRTRRGAAIAGALVALPLTLPTALAADPLDPWLDAWQTRVIAALITACAAGMAVAARPDVLGEDRSGSRPAT